MSQMPSWLTPFFTAPNKLNLEVIAAKRPELTQLLQPLLDTASTPAGPTVVPWTDGKQWWLYCCSADGKATRELQRLLRARLGSVHSYPEVLLVQQPLHQSEQLLLTQFPEGILKLELFPFSNREQIRYALTEVIAAVVETLELLQARPPMLASTRRPVGQILRNLITACAAKDSVSSGDYLDELKASGDLSNQNLLLIELQRLGHLEQWQELLQHPKLVSLMMGRVPSSLVELLLTGLHTTVIDAPAAQLTPEALRGALLAFEPLYCRVPLFGHDDQHEAQWRVWGCGAALLGLEHWSQSVPRQLIAEIEGLTGVTAPTVAEAPPEVETTPIPQSLEQLVALLNQQVRCNQDSASQLQHALQQLSPQLLQQLQQFVPLQQQINSLHDDVDALTEGWSAWLTLLQQGTTEGLLQQLTQHQAQWTVDSYQESQLLALLSQDLSLSQIELIRTMLPLWLLWTEKHEVSASTDVMVKLLELLAADDVTNPEDLRLAQMMLERLMLGSMVKQDYQHALEAYQMVFEKNDSVVAIDRACESLEWLLDQAVLSMDALELLWRAILQVSLGKWRRLDSELTQVLRLLTRDFNEGEQFLPPEAQDKEPEQYKLPDLTGKLLAMYGLTEGALRRAKAILQQRYPELQIDINHDHCATSKLKHLAQKADYFLFMTGSAKHQAFYPVSEIRSDLIYPKGKGTTSIVRAVGERINVKVSE
ncbi:protein DpdD [Ferrimonas senticii]|uniref:protein DpdD n=1 Tax=Ferrimonas senticii TaxID=394566 RepID=UPI000413840F|nr:protein DpdD [Ferrimonas senticii]